MACLALVDVSFCCLLRGWTPWHGGFFLLSSSPNLLIWVVGGDSPYLLPRLGLGGLDTFFLYIEQKTDFTFLLRHAWDSGVALAQQHAWFSSPLPFRQDRGSLQTGRGDRLWLTPGTWLCPWTYLNWTSRNDFGGAFWCWWCVAPVSFWTERLLTVSTLPAVERQPTICWFLLGTYSKTGGTRQTLLTFASSPFLDLVLELLDRLLTFSQERRR